MRHDGARRTVQRHDAALPHLSVRPHDHGSRIACHREALA